MAKVIWPAGARDWLQPVTPWRLLVFFELLKFSRLIDADWTDRTQVPHTLRSAAQQITVINSQSMLQSLPRHEERNETGVALVRPIEGTNSHTSLKMDGTASNESRCLKVFLRP